MKIIIYALFLCLFSLDLFAQQQEVEVTKFLGIPVDGTKYEMSQKLREKGFVWNKNLECFEGEFNGTDVYVGIVTNNNKVYRIYLRDAKPSSEVDIKIRFNKLCSQFEKNGKYIPLSQNQQIDDEEDISYEILVNKKRYEAIFFQTGFTQDDLNSEKVKDLFGNVNEKLKDKTEEERKEIMDKTISAVRDYLKNRLVWFIINEVYGKYYIAMFYYNEYNHSDGEDL